MKIDKTKFVPIPGFEDLYGMSPDKQVLSFKRRKLKEPTPQRNGQFEVVLYKNNVPYCYTVKSLYDRTFGGMHRKSSLGASHKLICQNDKMCFSSKKEAAVHYGIIYKKFLTEFKNNNGQVAGYTFTQV